jgi:chromosomal replication initiator protein
MMQEYTPQEVWTRIIEETKNQINSTSYNVWLRPASAVALSNDLLVVEVQNQFAAEYIEDHFSQILKTKARDLFNREFTISFQSLRKRDESPLDFSEEVLLVEEEPVAAPSTIVLNDRFTFDNFVVGKSNRFSHAAAFSVAQNPALNYNPLFIYGGTGLGKTHLMQAIGNYVIKHGSTNNIHYSSAESFMNEMIQSIQTGTMIDFRNKYRRVDILLIDDIQFLANKESTQEEFFHTFNTLYDSSKQMVLTSDRPPREISNIEERLISRFQWGLVTDIQPPDLETRMAILKKKAISDSLILPEEVLMFIAKHIKSNVRELEGSLIRLLAYSSLSGIDITVDLAEEVLKNILQHEEKNITVEHIQNHVAGHYKISVSDLKSKKRTNKVTLPRQIAMFLCRSLTDLSLIEVGAHFGGRDHTTVMHACDKIEKLVKTDRQTKRDINLLSENIENDSI